MSVWQKNRINILRALSVAFVLLALAIEPAFESGTAIALLIHTVGSLLLFFGVLGRLWCTLYIGGRKNLDVIDTGPYSICRHPLYFFSSVSTLGFGLLLGSIVVALVIFSIVSLVLMKTASDEECFLQGALGASYMNYSRTVPRFFPKARLFTTGAIVNTNVSVLKTNFMDGLVFLSLLPLATMLSIIRDSLGWEVYRFL